MKKENFLLIIGLVVVLSALVLRVLPREKYTIKVPPIKEVGTASSSEMVTIPEIIKEPEVASSTEEVVLPVTSTSSEVVINKPAIGEIVSSPLTVEGKALGNWFFEATLPVKLITASGDIILVSYGQAQSDWMTPDFVPFKSVLEFNTTATSGYLVIFKDNPSGLPEHDASVAFPVLFK